MRKGWLIVISLAVAIVLLGAAGCAVLEGEAKPALAAATLNTQQMGIWVSGQGKVSVTPDIAILRLSIVAQEANVAEAQTKANEAMNKVMTTLTDWGVVKKDIQTQYFNIRQRTKWDRETEEDIVIGYQVTNTVIAKIRVLDIESYPLNYKVGIIINAVVEAGGDLTRMHGISFSVEDPTAYQEQAREKAFADARAKAEQLARLADLTLGKATYITEGMGHLPMPMRMDVALADEHAVPTPIMPGEQEIIVNVQVAFAIE